MLGTPYGACPYCSKIDHVFVDRRLEVAQAVVVHPDELVRDKLGYRDTISDHLPVLVDVNL